MTVTTVLIKGHKKGVVNLFIGMTWPTDPMGKLKWNRQTHVIFLGSFFLVNEPVNPIEVNQNIDSTQIFSHIHLRRNMG